MTLKCLDILTEDGAYAYEAVKDILKEEEPSIHTRMTKEDVLLAKDGVSESFSRFSPTGWFSGSQTKSREKPEDQRGNGMKQV